MEDGSSPLWGIVVLGLFIVINGIFHAFGSALGHVRESDIEKRAEEGDKTAQKILFLLEHPGVFHDSSQTIAMLLGLINGYIGIRLIVSYLYHASESLWIQHEIQQIHAVPIILAVICLLAVIVLLAFGYLIPRKLAKQHPEKTLFRYYKIIAAMMMLFSPLLFIGRIVSNLVVRLFGIDPHKKDDEVTEEEIISMVDEAHEQGVLQESEAEMIQNIFEFTETMTRDIMTHRKNMIAFESSIVLDDALKFMLDESYSRYPVYDGDIDNIIGIIHLKDVMRQTTFGQNGSVSIANIPQLIRQVEFVPETRSIDRVFQYMQSKKAHMVIVVDEYGQTAGLVAMEDILEEIVGNILDEYDDDELFIVPQGDDTMLMDGLTPLKQVSEVLQTDFMNEDYETLNGYLTSVLDHIPTEQDKEVIVKGFSFQILKVENHIIQNVRVEKITVEKGEEKCQDIQNLQT